jgi:phospholipid transport system transporter-binding protein
MISCVDGRCALQGPVTMATAPQVLEESARVFSGAHIVVDLAGVTEVDSAAVSLLLEWRRQARTANRTIEFANVPVNLQSLAVLYGVSELLARA